MVCIDDVYVLITYSTIVESFFIMLSVSSVLYFRYTRPDMVRPIKLPVAVPIVFVVICAFLIVVPCYVAPWEVGMGVAITLIGVPVYYVGVAWKSKPVRFQSCIGTCVCGARFGGCAQCSLLFIYFFAAADSITVLCQKLFLTAKEEQD